MSNTKHPIKWWLYWKATWLYDLHIPLTETLLAWLRYEVFWDDDDHAM